MFQQNNVARFYRSFRCCHHAIFSYRYKFASVIIPTEEEEKLFRFASETALKNKIEGIRVAGGWVRNKVRIDQSQNKLLTQLVVQVDTNKLRRHRFRNRWNLWIGFPHKT